MRKIFRILVAGCCVILMAGQAGAVGKKSVHDQFYGKTLTAKADLVEEGTHLGSISFTAHFNDFNPYLSATKPYSPNAKLYYSRFDEKSQCNTFGLGTFGWDGRAYHLLAGYVMCGSREIRCEITLDPTTDEGLHISVVEKKTDARKKTEVEGQFDGFLEYTLK